MLLAALLDDAEDCCFYTFKLVVCFKSFTGRLNSHTAAAADVCLLILMLMLFDLDDNC